MVDRLTTTCFQSADFQVMDMMPTASLMEQDSFKQTPVSSASLTAHNNMLTPSQPPKVLLYLVTRTRSVGTCLISGIKQKEIT